MLPLQKWWVPTSFKCLAPLPTVQELNNWSKISTFFGGGDLQERLQNLWEVYHRLGLEDDIIDPSNELIKEGPIQEISFRHNSTSEKYLFLVSCIKIWDGGNDGLASVVGWPSILIGIVQKDDTCGSPFLQFAFTITLWGRKEWERVINSNSFIELHD